MAGRARKGQRGKGKGVEEHGGEERGQGNEIDGNERKEVVCLEIVDQGPDFQNFLRSKILEKSQENELTKILGKSDDNVDFQSFLRKS